MIFDVSLNDGTECIVKTVLTSEDTIYRCGRQIYRIAIPCL